LQNDYESLSGNKLIYISWQVRALDFSIDWAVEVKLQDVEICFQKFCYHAEVLTLFRLVFKEIPFLMVRLYFILVLNTYFSSRAFNTQLYGIPKPLLQSQ